MSQHSALRPWRRTFCVARHVSWHILALCADIFGHDEQQRRSGGGGTQNGDRWVHSHPVVPTGSLHTYNKFTCMQPFLVSNEKLKKQIQARESVCISVVFQCLSFANMRRVSFWRRNMHYRVPGKWERGFHFHSQIGAGSRFGQLSSCN